MKAFSMIELLVTILVVSILSCIAMPIYKTYLVKARLAELFTIANSYKLNIVDQIIANESVNYSVNLSSKFASSLNIAANQDFYLIQVIGNKDALGLTNFEGEVMLQLRARKNMDFLSWSCYSSANVLSLMPSNCRSSIENNNG